MKTVAITTFEEFLESRLEGTLMFCFDGGPLTPIEGDVDKVLFTFADLSKVLENIKAGRYARRVSLEERLTRLTELLDHARRLAVEGNEGVPQNLKAAMDHLRETREDL